MILNLLNHYVQIYKLDVKEHNVQLDKEFKRNYVN